MKRRSGFTLLELILALGLTVVILSAVTSAIHLYMLQLDRRQSEIERKQISRGVVRMISEDLRAAIQYKSEDYSGLENLIASQSLAGVGGLATGVDDENIDGDQLEQQILDAVAQGGGAGGEEAVPANDDDSEDDEGNSNDSEEEETDEEQGRPTLIGNNYFIRIDTSRLPRLDEYNPLVARRASEERLPSDIKTITYFFSDASPVTSDEIEGGFGQHGGLYRRQVDRAVEAYQSDEAVIQLQPDENSELISPEVSAVQFRYWNGENWLAEWDSSDQGGFPSAIEVRIVIDSERVNEDSAVQETDLADVEVVRTVVHLPVAEVIDDDEGDSQ